MNVVKFSASVQRHEMYEQFTLYMNNARIYLNFGNSEIANTIIYLNQSAHDLCNEKNIWAEYIEKAIKAVDKFGKLNEYWLDWSTDSRIALMKKWATLIVYSSKSAAEDVSNGLTEYALSENTFLTDSGQSISYKSRVYKEKYEMTKLIDVEDLQYTVSDSKVIITGYSGYEGEYTNVALPDEIKGYPVTKIGNRAFDGVNWLRVIIPSTVTSIGEYAFYNNPALNDIVVLGDTQIANTAFDWRIDGTNGLSSDQSTGNVPIYCGNDSKAKIFADNKEGFYYKSLAWDGTTIWGVYPNGNKLNIYTGNELSYISYVVNAGLDLSDCEVVLKCDIDLGNKEFTPIGKTKDLAFEGSFNGEMHTVKNFYPNKKNSSVGLFGYIDGKNAEYKNVKIYGNCENTSEGSRGSIIGEANLQTDSALKIINIESHFSDTKFSGSDTLGGIIGKIASEGNSTILLQNCSHIGDLIGKGGFAYPMIGGVVGYSQLTSTDRISFIKCSSSGTYSYNRNFQIANGLASGLLAKGERGNYVFDQCCVTGKVKCNSNTTALGTFVSNFIPDTFQITNCETFANVVAEGSMVTVVGGFIGGLDTTYLSSTDTLIKNSYVSSVLKSGFGSVGAFISSHDENLSNYSISVENCFLDKDKTSVSDKLLVMYNHRQLLGGAKASQNDKWSNSGVYTSETLRTNHSLYSDWDFDSVWEYTESGYPRLKAFEFEPCSSHNYSKVIKEPTCDDQGYTTFTCNDCGYEYKGDYVSKLGHSYVDTVLLPTCTTQGYTEHKCSKCGNTYKDNYVDKLGHLYKVTEKIEPTCFARGYTEYTCDNCGDQYNGSYVAILDHSKSVKLENEESPLIVTYCTRCNTIFSESEIEIKKFYNQGQLEWTYAILDDEVILISYEKENTIVNVPKSIEGVAVTKLCEKLFNNKRITEIVIPDSVEYIGYGIFEGCVDLCKVTLSNNLDTIPMRTFLNCKNLTSIFIPKSIKNIYSNAFSGCISLSNVKYEDTEVKWNNVVVSEGNDCLLNAMFEFELETTRTYYFENNRNWNQVYAYTWYYNKTSSSAVKTKEWPGEKMNYVGKSSDGNDIYSIDISSNMDYIIFDMGSSQEQTIDIAFENYKDCNAFRLSPNMENNHYKVEGFKYNAKAESFKKMINQTIVPDETDKNVDRFNIGEDIVYNGLTLLGVQKKGDGTDSVRFVTVVSSDVLSHEDVVDYGYVFATTLKETTAAKQKSGNLTIENGHKYSCKGTINTMTGGYGDVDFTSTPYKYVTAAVNNINSDKALVARFYIETSFGTYYASYTDGNGDTFNGCVVRWSEIQNY
ncbi:MAG: leucine-rich repeat protein [Ruminococcus sp.]